MCWYPTTTSQTRRREPRRIPTSVHLHHFGTLTPDQPSNPRKGQAGLDWYGGRNTTDLPRPLNITTTYTKWETPTVREQPIPPRKRSRPGSDGIKHGIPPPSRSSSGVRTCTQHGTLSWHRRTRSFRNKDSPCSRLREPVALHALCVCVCAGDSTKPFGSLCWCFTTDGRTGRGREERETSSCILHRTVVRAACGLWICVPSVVAWTSKRGVESPDGEGEGGEGT